MTTIRERILGSLAAKSRSLTELSSSFSTAEQSLLHPILSELIDNGDIVVRTEGKTKVFTLKDQTIRLAPPKNAAAETRSVQLVATLPESIWASAPGVVETRAIFRRIIEEAETELVVVEPFIDTFFIELFAEELRRAAQRGCHVLLVTRRIEQGTDSQKSLLRLFEMFATRRLSRGKLEVYEHWHPFHGKFGQQFQFVGLHAKIMMNDKEAYIGSANWTEYSLGNNVEFGVVLRDLAMLAELHELIFLVMTSSRKVDLARMHQTALDRSRHT